MTFGMATIIVGHVLGIDDQAKIGVLFRWYMMATTLRTMILGPMAASISNAWAEKDYGWLKRALNRGFGLVGIMTIAAVLAFVVGGSWLTGVLFKDIHVEQHVFYSFAFMFLMSAINGSIYALVMALDSYTFTGKVSLVRGTVGLVVGLLVMPVYGINGYFWVTGITMLGSVIWTVWVLRDSLRTMFFGESTESN